ncbi:DUF6113 family protein [Streptomyces clavuligerus]|uniref:Putative integral membrane protein n=1 Tax=Streptomyces clavuligerus TaxID=1901 RepID=E2Q4Q4_STRCL|nr:DUF6113 family protein [Streptomyces clavuligerus]ANW18316.1 hypothetical protein BB341_08790 [Streptomyces clavuligerus]AXU12874.1 hypothetical protein D1794_09115 [Streptomyces clavuligerus]EFG09063.1 Putative integral membrane protein [Streptomyces clavuligerus]MBY6302795.1 hypothetical protein [Streptomyces clavuligerus]QCS05657.1 hypothetical protein CRV15_08545 [Streptomyces clavuligerus]
MSGRTGGQGARPAPGSPAGSWLATPPRPGRIAAYAALAVLGAAVGVAGALLQSAWFPGGLALALLGTAGLFHGAARALRTQLAVVAPALGWLTAVILLSVGRPEGDGVLAAGTGSLLFLVGGMVLAVMCATMARPAQPGGLTTRLDP